MALVVAASVEGSLQLTGIQAKSSSADSQLQAHLAKQLKGWPEAAQGQPAGSSWWHSMRKRQVWFSERISFE